MKRKSVASSTYPSAITVESSKRELEKVDTWIAKRTEPRPARSQAIRAIFALGLVHENKVEYLQERVAQAEKDIREQFDRVLGTIEQVSGGESHDYSSLVLKRPH